MKWFKHQSAARKDERIAHLEQLAGLEGYGFYFKLLEVVAEAMDAGDKCSLNYPLTTWSHVLHIHHNKFSKLLGMCEVTGLVSVKYHEGNRVGNGVGKANVRIEVIIPNLLKYRDNHTKNLQVTSKQELDIDKEIDKEVEKTKEKSADKSAVESLPIPDFISADLWADFIEVRKGLKAKNTLPAIKALINQLEKLKDAGHDPSEVVRTSIRSSWKDLYPLKANATAKNGVSSIADQNKLSTEIARQKLFGVLKQEKDITDEARTI